MASRILILGGPGSGKTTLGDRLAQRTGLPVTHLDEIARVGGGRGPERPGEDRARDVAHLAATEGWIAEGVHLGWTDPLLARAQLIVWLDHVSAPRSSGRIVRRFLSQALAEARSRRGRERFLRLRDYARKVRELIVSVPETRTYPDAALEEALAPFRDKVVRCRTEADIDDLVARVGGER